MGYPRLMIGFLIIGFAGWIVLGEQISGTSSDAVVNARLTTIRAPIAGKTDMPFRPFGTRVREGETLLTIVDPMVDTIRLRDLEMEHRYMAAQINRVEMDVNTTGQTIAELVERNASYHAHRLSELDAMLERARERVEILRGPERYTPPGTPKSDLTKETEGTSTALSLALQEVETLTIAYDAALNGTFLGDGYNDASATEIRAIELGIEHDRLTSELQNLHDRFTALDARIVSEQTRVSLQTAASLESPIDGILWEVLVGDGETVQRGQDVLKLMHCGSALVTLSVPDIVYNRLRVGQVGRFRLDGSTETFDGSITRMAGSGAETIYRNLAISPSQKHLERYDVTLLVPALREDPQSNCTVGQTGRVFFDPRPLDWLRGLLN